jgi:hypothetical protein
MDAATGVGLFLLGSFVSIIVLIILIKVREYDDKDEQD